MAKSHPHQSTPPENLIQPLPGEVVVGHTSGSELVLYESDSPDKPPSTVTGILFVTNYRCGFKIKGRTMDKFSEVDKEVILACENIPLGMIDYTVTIGGSGKKRPLTNKSTLPKKIAELEVACKDLRKFRFILKKAEKSEALHTVNTLNMYTNPSSVYNLFAFDYARVVHSKKDSIVPNDPSPSFFNPRDWQKELDRLGVNQKQWRVTDANSKFLLCESLPPFIVVPYNISDETLEYVASLHSNNRLPVWCWSHPISGVSLTRAAHPDEDKLEAPDPSYLYAVSMARNLDVQVENKHVEQFNVNERCGFSVKDIQSAFSKIQELCQPASPHDLIKFDQRWLNGLDSSGWLYFVRACLELSRSVTETLCLKRTSCLLLEDEDRDISCVISSLVQLISDPHYRSISGFELLIQKEWVALGHPFTSRGSLVVESSQQPGAAEKPGHPSPVFLLFLDCVWQLSQQFLSAFQFSETYLVQLYSLVHNCLYGNFLFDSARSRLQASLHSKRSSYYGTQDDQYGINDADQYEGPLVSAWGNWRSSLTDEQNETWLNPFYYIFGSSDANYDCLARSPFPFDPVQFNSAFSDIFPDSSQGGNYGLYTDRPVPASPVYSTASSQFSSQFSAQFRPGQDDLQASLQVGLLLPTASICSVQLWQGFFFRYIPELCGSGRQRVHVQEIENRLVKEVRKLKDLLNECEINQGAQASDLTSFIGKILRAREDEKREKKIKLQRESSANFNRISAFASMSSEDEDGEGHYRFVSSDEMCNGSPVKSLERSRTLPPRLDMSGRMDESLSKFKDALYSKGGLPKTPPRERLTSSCSAEGRSPIMKTRIKVQKEESTNGPMSPAMRWVGSSPGSGHKNLPITPSPTIVIHRKTTGVIEEELTEL